MTGPVRALCIYRFRYHFPYFGAFASLLFSNPITSLTTECFYGDLCQVMQRLSVFFSVFSGYCLVALCGCQTISSAIGPWFGGEESVDAGRPPSVAEVVREGVSEEIPAAYEDSLPTETKAVPIVPLRRITISDVEVSWLAPSQESGVDSYVLYVGTTPDSFTREIRLTTAQLEQREDPQHGTLYSYTLRDVPAETPLYFALASVKNGAQSDRSAVFMLSPQNVSRQ